MSRPDPELELSGRRRETLTRYARQYEALKGELAEIGYVVHGSLAERWMLCGRPECACAVDPDARHGPYSQWSWKAGGRTVSCYLNPSQARLCRTWINNNRRLDRLLRRMRALSLRVARLYEIAPK